MNTPSVTKVPRKRLTQHPRLQPCPSAVVAYFKPRLPHPQPSTISLPSQQPVKI